MVSERTFETIRSMTMEKKNESTIGVIKKVWGNKENVIIINV